MNVRRGLFLQKQAGAGVAELGSALHMSHGLEHALGYTVPFFVTHGKAEERFGRILLCRQAEPFHSLGIILLQPV